MQNNKLTYSRLTLKKQIVYQKWHHGVVFSLEQKDEKVSVFFVEPLKIDDSYEKQFCNTTDLKERHDASEWVRVLCKRERERERGRMLMIKKLT